MRSSEDFRTTVRNGVRAGRRSLVVHGFASSVDSGDTRVGFVVSRAVGNAVVRNRVKRRLRHLTATALQGQPDGRRFVVRALPAAAGAPALAEDFHSAWSACLRKLDSV